MSDKLDLTLLMEGVKTLQSDVRAIKRDMAMLRAQNSELPSTAQFQAGLQSLDDRTTELHNVTMAALAELTALVREKLP